MKLAVSTLCDAATVRDGLLTVAAGGITHLVREPGTEPFTVQCAIALMFILEGPEDNGASIRINLVGPDGEPVEGIDDYQTEIDGFVASYPASSALVLGVHNMVLPTVGKHAYRVLANEVEIGSIDFVVTTPDEMERLNLEALARVADGS